MSSRYQLTLSNVTLSLSKGEKDENCPNPNTPTFSNYPTIHGLTGYFDLAQAKECAKIQNKSIFIDFTSHGCVNCRAMESRVWSNPELLKILKEDYVVVALYLDDKTELP